MESKGVKTVAILLIVGVALYAVYQVFRNTQLAGIGALPGTTTANLTGVPGVSEFPEYSPTSATPQALASVAATNLAEYTPAFGSLGGNTADSEGDTADYTDMDYED